MVRKGGKTIEQLVNGLERRVAFSLPFVDLETLKSTKNITFKERKKLVLKYNTLEVPGNAFVKIRSSKIKKKVVKGKEKKCAIFAGFQLFNMFPGNVAHVAYFEGIIQYMDKRLHLPAIIYLNLFISTSGDTIGRPVVITDMVKNQNGAPVFVGHDFTHVDDFFNDKPIDSNKINLSMVRQFLLLYISQYIHQCIHLPVLYTDLPYHSMLIISHIFIHLMHFIAIYYSLPFL